MEAFVVWVSAVALGFFPALAAQQVWATSYSGYSTGYAHGNLYNGQGTAIAQGNFANHAGGVCDPDDPAGTWAYGTYISSISPTVVTIDGYGSTTFRTSMVLRDVGDYACDGGHYWADWYFGRYENDYDCACNNGNDGVPDTCWYNYLVDNCDQAVNWGWIWSTYNK